MMGAFVLISLSMCFSYEISSYEGTLPAVKGIVGGLTSLSNSFMKLSRENLDNVAVIADIKNNIHPTEVFHGIKSDFARGYLFSGNISSHLYDQDCSFTDPTLSFQGLQQFKRNIESLKPLIDTFVTDNMVILYHLGNLPRISICNCSL